MEQFLREKGYAPNDLQYIGNQPGFLPAYTGTDARAQLSLLRQKVEEIRRASPADWAGVVAFLVTMFGGLDILINDPDLGEEEFAA